MNKLIRTGIVTLAGSVGAGLVLVGGTTANAQPAGADLDQITLSKRELDSVAWYVAGDDDDDSRSRSRSRTDGPSHDNTNSRSNDGTNSRFTAVSRDKDRSRGDLTRDWTRDGGDRTKDKSRNQTNDRSRNDTRRKWR